MLRAASWLLDLSAYTCNSGWHTALLSAACGLSWHLNEDQALKATSCLWCATLLANDDAQFLALLVIH